MRCHPSAKDVIVSRQPCFQCLRPRAYSEKYEFAWDCATDVMLKMTIAELNNLASQVLGAMRGAFADASGGELILLGDCYARVLIHSLKRGNYLRGSYINVTGVREIVRFAANKSMPAWGLWVAMERDDLPMPSCWCSIHQSSYNQG